MTYRPVSDQVVDTARSLSSFPGLLSDMRVVEALKVKVL
jgi:hypothetical protein